MPAVLEPLLPPQHEEMFSTVQFHAWPPANVYVDGRFLVEAPSPEAFNLSQGPHEVQIVSNRGERKRARIELGGGQNYIMKLNFDTGQWNMETLRTW